ncbi:MAG: hypothetical protein CVV02_01000 [Firmicutes bacterium HGW-Firmicutes-7]|nr:MAG: hypothetical protein CVV02_01000 [Firmicutes bacterium HGW-Firmicutes-7]
MYVIVSTLLCILNVSVLNIVLSCDSISVIALITDQLPSKLGKKVTIIGISTALIFTIIFASIISFIMEIQWLPIQLIGGVLLIIIAVDLIKTDGCDEKDKYVNKAEITNIKFFLLIFNIIIANITLSLDNVLAIAGAGNGNIMVIIVGLLISLPFVLFGSKYIIKVIKEKKIARYISGAILMYTALEMIISYKFIAPFIPKFIYISGPILVPCAIIVYGIYIIRKSSCNATSFFESGE